MLINLVLAIAPSALRRQRCKHREEKAAEIREFFSPTIPLTLHWDGKLMPSLTNDGTVDRLPIIVSGEGVLKLLAAPITDGKAEPTANTISNSGNTLVSYRVRIVRFLRLGNYELGNN